MEAGAEEGGVGQGLELAQEFMVILAGGEALQQAGGEMDEIAFLAGRAERMQAGSVGGFPHAGELEMGGEVALAWVLQRIGPGPVARVGLEGALGAVGVVVVTALEAVVDEWRGGPEEGRWEWGLHSSPGGYSRG